MGTGGQYDNSRFMDMTENPMLSSMDNYNYKVSFSKWRAKLYHLNSEGCWDDFGTGTF
jgi:hypothetical protein